MVAGDPLAALGIVLATAEQLIHGLPWKSVSCLGASDCDPAPCNEGFDLALVLIPNQSCQNAVLSAFCYFSVLGAGKLHKSMQLQILI